MLLTTTSISPRKPGKSRLLADLPGCLHTLCAARNARHGLYHYHCSVGDYICEWLVGDLLAAVVKPLGGFGTIILVLLALSVIANNIPNDYSLGLSIQVFGQVPSSASSATSGRSSVQWFTF